LFFKGGRSDLELTSDYEYKFINLILKNKVNLPINIYITKDFFSVGELGIIFEEATSLSKQYGIYPDWKILKSKFLDRVDTIEDKEMWLKIFRRISNPVSEFEEKYINDRILLWIRIQAIRNSIYNAGQLLSGRIEDLTNEDIDELENHFYNSFRIAMIRSEDYDYFEDIKQRMVRRLKNPIRAIRTLITELDQCLLLNGLARGELGFVLAHPNVGKTFFLVHVAKAGILQNLKVWFITLEMPYDVIAMRMDSAFTGVKINELISEQGLFSKKIDRFSKVYNGNLIISSYPTGFSVKNMDEIIRSLKSKGFSPDLIVIDSADLMMSMSSRGFSDAYSIHREQGDIYQELKGFGQKYNSAVWTAAWTKSGTEDKEILTMGDCGASRLKPAIADVMISLNQTKDEEKESKIRIYLGKNRNERAGIQIPIYTNFVKGQFYRKLSRRIRNEFG